MTPITALFEQYLKAGLYLKGWSTKTPLIYRRAFASLQQSLGDSPLHPGGFDSGIITKAQLQAWIVWMRERGLSLSCCNIYIRAMNSFCAWLREEGHLEEQFKLKQLPNPRKPLRTFSDLEARSILALKPKRAGRLRTYTLMCLLLDTGVRIDEALRVRWPDVDLENLVLTVHGKGNKERRVPFSVELRKQLFRYSKVAGHRAYVFSTTGGGRVTYRNTYRDIKAVCKQAGVTGAHVRPHSFRHYFAVSYIRNGGDIYRLSRILGHTAVTTTQLYLRSMGIEILGENHSALSPLSRLR